MSLYCKIISAVNNMLKGSSNWSISKGQEVYDLIGYYGGAAIRLVSAIAVLLIIAAALVPSIGQKPLGTAVTNPGAVYAYLVALGPLVGVLILMTVLLEKDFNKGSEVGLALGAMAVGLWVHFVFGSPFFAYLTGLITGHVFASLNKAQVKQWREKRRQEAARKALAATGSVATTKTSRKTEQAAAGAE